MFGKKQIEIDRLKFELKFEKEMRELDRKNKDKWMEMWKEESNNFIKLKKESKLIEKLTIALFSNFECQINFANIEEGKRREPKFCDVIICIPNIEEESFIFDKIEDTLLNNILKNYGYYFYIDNGKAYMNKSGDRSTKRKYIRSIL